MLMAEPWSCSTWNSDGATGGGAHDGALVQARFPVRGCPLQPINCSHQRWQEEGTGCHTVPSQHQCRQSVCGVSASREGQEVTMPLGQGWLPTPAGAAGSHTPVRRGFIPRPRPCAAVHAARDSPAWALQGMAQLVLVSGGGSVASHTLGQLQGCLLHGFGTPCRDQGAQPTHRGSRRPGRHSHAFTEAAVHCPIKDAWWQTLLFHLETPQTHLCLY